MAKKPNFGPDFGPFDPNLDPNIFFEGFTTTRYSILDTSTRYGKLSCNFKENISKLNKMSKNDLI